MNEHFTEEQIPYNILNRFGITQEMIEDLPASVLNRLLNGKRTPVLPIKYTNEHNELIYTNARLSLFRNDNGEPRVMFYPRFLNADVSRFSSEHQKTLNEGRAVLAEMPIKDGVKTMGYYQVDTNTNQILSAPTAVIHHNLNYLAEELNLSTPELNCLKNGNSLTLNSDDEQYTMGINLNSRTGVKMCEGDEQAWKEYNDRELEKFNFGLNGCWVADENGGLDYVPEENYGEDMWAEMKKRGEMNRVAAGLARSFK